MSKPKFAKYRATIEYQIELDGEQGFYEPSASDEKENLLAMLEKDPEIMKPKIKVEKL